jgi:uncharacterized repeat protein (TIGR03803 family)
MLLASSVSLLILGSPAFAVEPTIRVVYSFSGNNGTSDGYAPYAPLVLQSPGVFYGTTGLGGGSPNCDAGCGTVFRVNSDGSETIIYAFAGGSDGARPMAGLILGPDGTLYGTTEYGGDGAGCQSAEFIAAYGYSGCGIIYSIKSDGTEGVIYSLQGTGADGCILADGVVLGANGNLYGAAAGCGSYQSGMVFEVTPAGVETVLYSFTGANDGEEPNAVTFGKDGSLFGTTYAGGANTVGTVWKFTDTGVFSVLHTFGGPGDGAFPLTGLLYAKDGNFYGTTGLGGSVGYGALFKMTPSGDTSILYSFTSGVDGTAGPNGPLIENSAGTIFGTTQFGGTADVGYVYEYSSNGGFATLLSLPGYPSGSGGPTAGVTLGSGGNLFGTSASGGAYDGGTVFKVTIK